MKNLMIVIMAVIGMVGCGQAPVSTSNQVRTPETTCMFSWNEYLGPSNVLVTGNGDGTFVPSGCRSAESDACLSPDGNTMEIVQNGTITCEGLGSMNVVNGIPTWVSSN